MDKVNYDNMLAAFNSVLDGFPDDTSDMVIRDVNDLKGLFISYFGEES